MKKCLASNNHYSPEEALNWGEIMENFPYDCFQEEIAT